MSCAVVSTGFSSVSATVCSASSCGDACSSVVSVSSGVVTSPWVPVSSAAGSMTTSSRPSDPPEARTSANAWMLDDCITRTTLRKTASMVFHLFFAS